MEGHLGRVFGSEIENLVWGSEYKPARGSWGMLPREILKRRSAEIAGNAYFSIHFCIFKVFKESSQVARNGVLCPSLCIVGGNVSLVPPDSYVHAVRSFLI